MVWQSSKTYKNKVCGLQLNKNFMLVWCRFDVGYKYDIDGYL